MGGLKKLQPVAHARGSSIGHERSPQGEHGYQILCLSLKAITAAPEEAPAWCIVDLGNKLQCYLTLDALDMWGNGEPLEVLGLNEGPWFACPVEYMNEGYPELGLPVHPCLLRRVD